MIEAGFPPVDTQLEGAFDGGTVCDPNVQPKFVIGIPILAKGYDGKGSRPRLNNSICVPGVAAVEIAGDVETVSH